MSNLSENDMRKIALLKKVIHSVEDLQDEYQDEEDTSVYLDAEIKLLTNYLRYFELRLEL